jgi:hypothetical protein
LALVAVAAAERLFALIELGAAPRDAARARSILDDLWDAALNPDSARGMELAARVWALPRANIQEPSRLDDEAIETLFNAALIVSGRMEASSAAFGVLSGIDREASVRAGGPRARLVDPRNPPLPGPYAANEAEREQRDAGLALTLGSTADVHANLRRTAATERAALVTELRQYVPPATLFHRLKSYLPPLRRSPPIDLG